ncbi:MAG: hypothetical protein M1820_007925 [Bogoriella megaspora]|nr:MAG: hypothetical protein M1820_007925 [Bogoriella megaspora]
MKLFLALLGGVALSGVASSHPVYDSPTCAAPSTVYISTTVTSTVTAQPAPSSGASGYGIASGAATSIPSGTRISDGDFTGFFPHQTTNIIIDGQTISGTGNFYGDSTTGFPQQTMTTTIDQTSSILTIVTTTMTRSPTSGETGLTTTVESTIYDTETMNYSEVSQGPPSSTGTETLQTGSSISVPNSDSDNGPTSTPSPFQPGSPFQSVPGSLSSQTYGGSTGGPAGLTLTVEQTYTDFSTSYLTLTPAANGSTTAVPLTQTMTQTITTVNTTTKTAIPWRSFTTTLSAGDSHAPPRISTSYATSSESTVSAAGASNTTSSSTGTSGVFAPTNSTMSISITVESVSFHSVLPGTELPSGAANSTASGAALSSTVPPPIYPSTSVLGVSSMPTGPHNMSGPTSDTLITSSTTSATVPGYSIITTIGPSPVSSTSASPSNTTSTAAASSSKHTTSSAKPNSSSTTSQSSAPSSTCTGTGPIGDFVINYDDLPAGPKPTTPINASAPLNGQTAPPIFSPYHDMFYSYGFVYAPPPSDPFTPSSPPQLAAFIPSSATQSHGDIGTLFSGEIGAGDESTNSAFFFNVYSANLGCDIRQGPSVDCNVVAHGYRFDGVTGNQTAVAYQFVQLPPCANVAAGGCQLSAVSFGADFRNLTGVEIRAYDTKENQLPWFMDDLKVGWTDNSCAAVEARQNFHA